MSTDHPATTFINFFPKKYLLAVYKDIMVIPVLLHCVLGKHLVKIDELWPNGSHYITKYHKVGSHLHLPTWEVIMHALSTIYNVHTITEVFTG